MEKPGLIKRKELLDYHQIIKFIEDKYKIEVRDFSGWSKWLRANDSYKQANKEPEYLDYWHWMLGNVWPELSNGTTQYWNLEEILEDSKAPDWVRTITQYVKDEFSEYLDKDGGFEVIISW